MARLTLLDRSSTDRVLLIAVRHIATDLWSMALLGAELSGSYREVLTGDRECPRTSTWACGPSGARPEQDLVSGPAGAASREFWRHELQDVVSTVDLPTDRARPQISTGRGRVPLATMFAAESIAGLAEVVTQVSSSPWTSAVQLHPSGERPALFMVTPLMTTRSGSGGWPVPSAPTSRSTPSSSSGSRRATVEELAAEYVREIRELQPNAPFVIGGPCSGTGEALEIVRRLQAGEAAVAPLLVIDADPARGRTRLCKLRPVTSRAGYSRRHGGFVRSMGGAGGCGSSDSTPRLPDRAMLRRGVRPWARSSARADRLTRRDPTSPPPAGIRASGPGCG